VRRTAPDNPPFFVPEAKEDERILGQSESKARVERVRSRVTPVVAREGFELIDVELTSEHGRAILRLYIDTIPPGTKERGVTVDDCSHVSRIVGDLLDIEEIIDGQYHLEVSSPGLFRPLTKPEHFDRVIGALVKVKTYEKVDGRRVFTGILKGHEKGMLKLEVDGHEYAVALEQIAKANLEPSL
jgi:ribosome maturation factor RimP